MEHTNIVSAAKLNEYAERRESESVIPELIWLLVNGSVGDLTACRIPYGDNVNQPGWDGLVESPAGYRQFVPANVSYWEIGTGAKPQDKATTDFAKRTSEMSPEEKAAATYVFVTPRTAGSGGWTEPAQRSWKSNRSTSGWHRINILDGQHLEDWLRDFPALGRWFLKRMEGLSIQSKITTPAEHWQILSDLAGSNEISRFENVFLAGRDIPAEQLMRLLSGESRQLLLAIESDQDAEDFVSAYLKSLEIPIQRKFATTCLFIGDAESWRSVVNLRIPHVLVAHPKVGIDSDDQLLAIARKNGHRVVIPVSGTWAHGNRDLVQLRSPSRGLLERTLRECGFEDPKVSELAGAGALSLAALRRHILGLGSLPPYATWDNARVLAQAGLMGKWNGENVSDTSAMEIFLGKPYGEWIDAARTISLRSEAPLIQRNETWKMICRGEAWDCLGSRISNDDLSRFESIAMSVLGEKDPKFELPVSEHYMASIRGKKLAHSKQLRNGMTESLALLGSRPEALSFCSRGNAENTASKVVKKLLAKTDWHLWASLHDAMPLLAEAAPDEYMHAIELALADQENSMFKNLFAQESTDIGGWNYTSGLLWGLENLTWNPEYLVRATLILGGLANADPGGKWANRPANSLVDIFLPWHPQTLATISLRVSAVKALVKEYPEVGWKLLLSLLPSMHGSTTGCHKPTWRKYIPSDWKQEVSQKEYWDQISAYADMANEIILEDEPKLAELIDRIPDLPDPALTNVLSHLASEKILSLPEEVRLSLWESLVDLSNKHRKFSDTHWAMLPERVSEIERVAASIAPTSPHLLERRLFSERDFDLYDETGDFEAQRKRLDEKRLAAVKRIFTERETQGILDFVADVESPRKVGYALGLHTSDSLDAELIPKYLDSSDTKFQSFIGSFIYSRIYSSDWTWIDTQLSKDWSPAKKLRLLLLAPFSEKSWQRAELLLKNESHLYWNAIEANPWGLADDWLVEAAQKLVLHERPIEAIDFFYVLIHRKIDFPTDLAIESLLKSVSQIGVTRHVDRHHLQEVIKYLQENMPDDSEELFNVEWAYLSTLDSRFGGTGPKTIEHRLATNPELFCAAISAVFRSDKDIPPHREPTETEKLVGRNAYRLLNGWRQIPGYEKDGSFDGEKFSRWLDVVKERSTQTGHFRIALSQLGQALTNSPPDPNGLWIHKSVAIALDSKDAESMRDGYRTGLFNLRGVFSPSGGKNERKIAQKYSQQAADISAQGFHRLAETLRGLSKSYISQAEHDEQSDPFDFD